MVGGTSMGSNIDDLSGIEFEGLIDKLLTKMGLVTETTKQSGDGGIDLVVHDSRPISGGKYIVQCKRSSSTIGEPVIRDLYGTTMSENASKGILITTNYFTPHAKDFAEEKQIELIDRDKLNELLVKHEIFETDDDIILIPYSYKYFDSVIYPKILKDSEEIKQIEDGLKVLDTKRYNNLDAYKKFFFGVNDSIENSLHVATNLFNGINEYAQIFEPVEPKVKKKIESHWDEIYSTFIRFIKAWKKTKSAIPDTAGVDKRGNDFVYNKERLEYYEKAIMTLIEEQVNFFEDVHNGIQSVKVPESGGTIRLSYTATFGNAEFQTLMSKYEFYDGKSKQSKSAGCFIATAVFGTPLAEEINILRAWRDNSLLTNPFGRLFVRFYYIVSPPIARLISKSEKSKRTVRFFIRKILSMI